jgi:hypothetical protein
MRRAAVLRIDRVDAEMEILPDQAGQGAGTTAIATRAGAVANDQFRTMVIEVLRDRLRELERRGVL